MIISGPTKKICSEYRMTFTTHTNLAYCEEKCNRDQTCKFFSLSDSESRERGVVCKTYDECNKDTLKTSVREQTIYAKYGK